MKVATYEAIVENGEVKLTHAVKLPERAKVFVVVPDMAGVPTYYIRSPRLAQPELANNFEMDVTEEPLDAGVR